MDKENNQEEIDQIKKEEDLEEKEAIEAGMEQEIQTNLEDIEPKIEEASQAKSENKHMKGSKLSRSNWFAIIALVLILSFVGGFGGVYFANQFLASSNAGSWSGQAITINTNDSINTVSAVVQKNIKSVVGITTLATQINFFSQPQDVSGVGSGVIVHKDGYILTNSHVVADGEAKEIKVLFEDEETVDARVVWVDPLIDLAVLKVEKSGLPAVELGDSDELIVGEIAIAIGNPLGLEFERSVTSGIISGLNRSVQVDESNIIDYLIQTDASINPGNSGGPLLNSKGQVIAINTAKVKTAEGLGFAIPINQVKAVVEEIIETGKFESVYLGITGVRVQQYEQRLGIKIGVEEGIVVIDVEENSAADKAGILAGDVIQGIDDYEVTNMGQLKRKLYNFKQGESATIKLIRNGSQENIDIEFVDVK